MDKGHLALTALVGFLVMGLALAIPGSQVTLMIAGGALVAWAALGIMILSN